MGCCLIAILAAFWPRVILVLLYFFNPGLSNRVFHTALYPLLGFIFLPTTTLAYVLCSVYITGGVHNTWSMIILVVAFLHDIGQFGALRRRRKVV